MKRNLAVNLVLVCSFAARAVVQVDFSHLYIGPPAVTQNTGSITLDFTVDGAGAVTLDASCTDPDPAVYVDGFDGAVGSLTNTAFWGESFSITLAGIGNLRIDNGGNGLSIQGGNAQRVDWANEGISASESIPDGTLSMMSISYANATTSAGTLLDLNEDSYALSGAAGTIPVAVEGDFTISSASDADAQGFVLAGFSFDVVSVPNENMEIGTDLTREITVTLGGSSTNFNYTGTSNGMLVVGSAATILTVPDGGGTSPVELGNAGLSLEPGSQWILDGSAYTNGYSLGDRFVLANYGAFSGDTWGVRYRNFSLPADRELELFNTATALYYEVVAQTPASGPNIIIVNVDDMVGGQHFNFEGRDCLTPTLDSFAANGINFTEAFAASTVCGPSRYALMTGRYASRNTSDAFLERYPLNTIGRFGVSDTQLEEDNQNLGAWLQQAGYRTGFVGKSHLVDDELKVGNWPANGLVTYGQTADPALDPEVNGAMRHNHRVLSQRMRPYGFDYVSGYYRANLLELYNDYLNVHNQEWITKHALEFIEENHQQRFFLYIAPTINHGPVRNDLSKSLLADPRYTSAGYMPSEDYTFMPARQAIVDEVNAAGKQLISARETWIDYSMAAISNKLAEHAIVNDTLIIFTADHGEKELNSSPVVWGKSSLYDLGMRVPLVMYWPGGISSPGRVYDESVQHIDFVPTLLELAGATNLPMRTVDGLSLVSVLQGSSAPLRDDVFCEIGYARAVRTKTWKYIAVRYDPGIYRQIEDGYLWKNFQTQLFTEPRPYYVNNSSLGYLAQSGHPGYYDDDQLYDLTLDTYEQSNLYGQYPAVAYELKKRLAEYMGDIQNRPFREFDDASAEFSPAPTSVPAAPEGLLTTFLDADTVQIDWSDAAGNELGYIVEESTNEAAFGMLTELPSSSTSATVSISSGIEDIRLRVSSYNVLGDTPASLIDLLAPDNWRNRTFGGTTGSNSQWTADADLDGLENIWEYAYATDPLDPGSIARSEGEIRRDGTNQWLQLVVPRDKRRDVFIEGRVSTNLLDWSVGEPDAAVYQAGETNLILYSTTPVGGAPEQFLGAEILIP